MKYIRDHFPEFILFLISFCLLLMLAVPYAVGYKVRQDYQELLTLLKKKSPYIPEAVVYDRGWFSSDVRTVIYNESRQPVLVFDQNIVHGPLYLGLLLKGRSPFVNMVIKGQLYAHEANRLLAGALTIKNSVETWVAIDFAGDASAEFSMPEFQMDNNSVHYELTGLALDLKYVALNDQLKGEAKVKSFRSRGESDLDFKSLVISYAQQIRSMELTGDMVLSIDEARYRKQSHQFDLYQVSSRLQNKQDGGWLDYQLDINIPRITLLNEQLNSLVFEMDIIRVRSGMLSLILNAIETGSLLSDPVIGAMLKEARMVVNPFNFYTEYGRFNAEADIKLRSDLPDNIMLDFTSLDINTSISMSQLLLHGLYEGFADYAQLAQRDGKYYAANLLKKGILRSDNHLYRLQLQKKSDHIMINDRQIDYNQFVQSLSQAN